MYRPGPAECADAQLYANNVQKVRLGIFQKLWWICYMKAFCIGPSTNVAGRGFLSRVRILASRIQDQKGTGSTKNLGLDRIPNPGSQIRILFHPRFRGQKVSDPGSGTLPGTMARHGIKLRLYCTNFNSLGLSSAFQYLKFLVLAKITFNWSITVLLLSV